MHACAINQPVSMDAKVRFIGCAMKESSTMTADQAFQMVSLSIEETIISAYFLICFILESNELFRIDVQVQFFSVLMKLERFPGTI